MECSLSFICCCSTIALKYTYSWHYDFVIVSKSQFISYAKVSTVPSAYVIEDKFQPLNAKSVVHASKILTGTSKTI
jgi:hypothetical protein